MQQQRTRVQELQPGLACSPSSGGQRPKFREWTDTTGKFHKTAKFRGMAGGVVKLELEDGQTISVPLEKLSDEDQEYVHQRRR